MEKEIAKQSLVDKKNEFFILTKESIQKKIYVIRGERVMLDFELAEIYGYETRYLNRQVKNNIEKFPGDFMFRLSKEELGDALRPKILTTEKILLNLKKS